MQFDWAKIRQSLKTLQFQRSSFNTRKVDREIACEIGEEGVEGPGGIASREPAYPDSLRHGLEFWIGNAVLDKKNSSG